MKKIINSEKAPNAIGPYNQAVLVGNLLFISGQIPINPKTNEIQINDIASQTKQVMENLKAILTEVNLEFKEVVKSTIYITDMNNFNIINEIYGSYFDAATAPARETVEVSKLPKSVLIEISIIAAISE